MPAKLSLCMIAKNEASNIEAVLSDVSGFVDEYIIVDTGSVDGTTDLINKMGIKPHFFSWIDDFSAAKNYAREKATGDWILFLDGDERISREDLQVIRDEIEENTFDAFRIEKRSHVNDSEMLTYRENIGKYPELELDFLGYLSEPNDLLFRNKDDIKFFGIIHETIGGSLAEGKYKIKRLDGVAIHNYGRHDMSGKNDLYNRLIDKRLEADDKDAGAWYYKGLNYDSTGYFEMAEECFEKALDIGFSDGAIYALALSQFRVKNLIDAEKNFLKYLKTNPKEAQAWKNLLYIAYYKKDEFMFELHVESLKANRMIKELSSYVAELYRKKDLIGLAEYYERQYG